MQILLLRGCKKACVPRRYEADLVSRLQHWHLAGQAAWAPGTALVGSSGGRPPARASWKLSRWSSRRTRRRAALAGKHEIGHSCDNYLHDTPWPRGSHIHLHRAVSTLKSPHGGYAEQAGTWSSMSRSAVQTAELTLKPDPKDSCHRRCPRFTPWRLSTNDQAYLRAGARVSAAARAQLRTRRQGPVLMDAWQGPSA